MNRLNPWFFVVATLSAPAWAQSEEVKALESDMEAAQEKTQAYEEIEPAPAGAAQTQTMATIRAKEEAEKKPWAVMVILDHAVGSGSFISDSTLRASRAYVAQSWDIRPSYTFPVADHKLKLGGRFVVEYEYTTPDTNPARRFKPADSRLYLSDAELYVEQLTGITFNAAATLFLPTSYESINVNKRWAGLRATAGASRSIGPVDLEYALAATKYLNSDKYRTVYSDVLRDGEGELSGTSEPGTYLGGPANTSFDIINSFGVTYNVTETLSVAYSLLIWNTFAYRDDAVNSEDELASVNADAGRGRTDMLWPSLEVAYRLDDVVKDILPFKLTVAGGITALHPAQTADNQGILWPVFYQAFGQNRAANNYGSIYFDLIGTL
ncbi:MAG: hypothetical protein HYZ27_07140 [Deltaproteobacteria bacterium]|nr:hypothetical protein [Deltaproteobacteria bacterium]